MWVGDRCLQVMSCTESFRETKGNLRSWVRGSHWLQTVFEGDYKKPSTLHTILTLPLPLVLASLLDLPQAQIGSVAWICEQVLAVSNCMLLAVANPCP